MKVSLQSSMSKRIEDARDQINAYFAALAAQSAALDAIHVRKREIASQVKAGAAAPDTFAREAALRGISAADLADVALAKPCPVAAADARELERQRLLLAVETAKTPVEINAVLASFGS